MFKSFLGVQLKQRPFLAWALILGIVAIQLVNRFVMNEKNNKRHYSIEELFSDRHTLQEEAQKKGLGFSDPLFQVAAADMYTARKHDNTKEIVSTILYYFFLLSGLVLAESVLGHFNMIMLVIVGVMVSYLTSAMTTISCVNNSSGVSVGLVGNQYCCGEYFTWFMAGVTMAVVFNYHFLKTKKVSHFLYGLMFLVFGFGVLMYQKYYYNTDYDVRVAGMSKSAKDMGEGTKWCIQATQSVVPYLLGGMTTMGMMGLLFTKA